MRDLRRTIGAIVIGAFSVAALLGILALLGPGEFGETEAQVVITTLIVGLESLAVLCYLALAGHRVAVVGAVGGVVSLVCAGTALWLLWADWQVWDEHPWQLFFSTLVLSLTLAQSSMLIALADRAALRPWLAGTLVVAGIVAVMVIVPILGESFPASDVYWRLLGVLGILDALGTVVLMAVGALGRRQPLPTPTGTAGPTWPYAVPLDPEVLARLASVARERGTTPSGLVTEALDSLGVADGAAGVGS